MQVLVTEVGKREVGIDKEDKLLTVYLDISRA